MSWTQKVSPARAPFTIAPSDVSLLPEGVKGVYVGTGGDVAVQGVGSDSSVIYRNVPDSGYLAVAAQRVLATGTTATDLVGEA